MIKAIGFDLDGTLIDSTDAIVGSFNHTFRALGVEPPPRQAILDTIGVPLEVQLAGFGVSDPAEASRVYREHYVREAPARTTLLPGARAGLERLRTAGMPIGLATSKRRSSAEVLLDHLGVLHHFRVLIGPEDVTRAKPDPESLHRLMDALEVEPGELLFVGDTHFDVEAAHNANVACWCVTTGYESRAELEALGPGAIFDSMAELVDCALTAVEFKR